MQMYAAVRNHWPEYLMEAAGLGCFMLSACLFTALFEYPEWPVRQAIPDPFIRRVSWELRWDRRQSPSSTRHGADGQAHI